MNEIPREKHTHRVKVARAHDIGGRVLVQIVNEGKTHALGQRVPNRVDVNRVARPKHFDRLISRHLSCKYIWRFTLVDIVAWKNVKSSRFKRDCGKNNCFIIMYLPRSHKLRRVGQQGLREFGGNHGKNLANYIPAIRSKNVKWEEMYNEKQNV